MNTLIFNDAHDLQPLTDRASEETVRRRLRERLSNAKQAIVLLGESTRHLSKFVRWEIGVCLDLDIPIVAVNFNETRQMDSDRCLPLLQNQYVVHVAYKAKINKYALDNFPSEYERHNPNENGPRYYSDDIYRKLVL